MDDIMDAFLRNFVARGDSEGGEGDYQDFLANYMNAVNQGGDSDTIQRMLDVVPEERLADMAPYGKATKLNYQSREMEPFQRTLDQNLTARYKR